MPGTDHPKRPRPKKVEFNNDTHSYIDCEDEVEEGTKIFDYTGDDDGYGPYEPTPNGEYNILGGGSIIVEDGEIQ